MAVAYGAASTPVATTTATTAVAYPAGITAGQVLYLIGAIKVGSTAMSATPALSGWTVEAFVRHGTTASGNDAGSMAFCVWSKTADGTESGTVSVAWGITPAAGQAWIVRLTNATGGWSTSVVTAVRTLSTTAWSVTYSGTAGLASGDLALCANAVPTDLSTASAAGVLTAVGLTSGSATERLTHRTDAGGSDSAVWLDSFAPTAGSASVAPTYTSTLTGGTNLYGVAVLIRAREEVLASQTVDPTGIGSVETLGSPTVTPGATSVTPAGVASAEAVGAVALTVNAPGPTGISGTFSQRYYVGGSLSQTVEPAGIASAQSIGAPTVTAGAVTVTPTGVGSAQALGSPTVTTGPVSVSPTGIGSAQAVGTPTVTPGAVTVAPTGVASAQAFGSPTVTPGGTSVAPTGVASAQALGSPTITAGSVAVSLSGIASSEAIGSPSVSVAAPGTQSVTPSGIGSAEAMGAPMVSPGTVVVDPSGIGAADAVGSPTVTPGPVTVAPSGVGSVEAIGTPAVSSLIVITPDGVGTQEAIGDLTISTVVTITPDGVSSEELVGFPRVTLAGEEPDERSAWIIDRGRIRVHIGGGIYR